MPKKTEDASRTNLHHRKILGDVETLKREEWNRRRLVRLEQVRQQSKDIASLVRHKVQNEREKQHSVVQERVTARVQQWQAKKLRALESEYQNTLKNVGCGHTEAIREVTKDEAQKAETERLLQAAQRRGQEALARLREEEAERRKADEARHTHQQYVRSVEEARSAAVVSLPLPESTVTGKSARPKKCVTIAEPLVDSKSTDTISKPAEDLKLGDTWQAKPWSQACLPLGVALNVDETATENQIEGLYDHGDRQAPSASSSQLGSATSKHRVKVPNSSKSSKSGSARSTFGAFTAKAASHYDVKLYDHTSRYHRHYDKCSGLADKVEAMPGEPNAHQVAEKVTGSEVTQSSGPAHHETINRQKERNRQALQRVHAQRDYQMLMTNLGVLAKQRAALTCFTSPTERLPSKNEGDKQVEMNAALEGLLGQGDYLKESADLFFSPSTLTPDGSLMVSRLEATPSSVPKLNVGHWAARCTKVDEKQPQSVVDTVDATQYRSVASSPLSGTSSNSNSIILAPAPCTSHWKDDDRNVSRDERNSALRTLLKRINEEREQLLLSSEQVKHNEQEQPQSRPQKQQQIQPHHSLQAAPSQHLKRPEHTQSLLSQNESQSRISQELESLQHKIMQQQTQLEDQHGELHCLDASDSTPHESIVIEDSESSGLSNGVPMPQQSTPYQTNDGKARAGGVSDTSQKSVKIKRKDMKRKKVKNKGESQRNHVGSGKDNTVYSMDLSLSSVTMDHTTNGSSGSQSLSLHGVQVLVKVCGIDDDSSQSIGDSEISIQQSLLSKVHHSGQKGTKSRRDHKTNQLSVHSGFRQPLLISDLAESQDEIQERGSNIKPTEGASEKEAVRKAESRMNTLAIHSDGETGTSQKGKSKKEKKKHAHKTINEGEKLQYPKKEHETPTSDSTSYLSPPDRVLSSLTKDIQYLLAIAKNNVQPGTKQHSQMKKSHGHKRHAVPNPLLSSYINRLLAMSRESVDRLNISTSEVSTPPSAIFDSPKSPTDSSYSVMSKATEDASPVKRCADSSATSQPSSVPQDTSNTMPQPHQTVDECDVNGQPTGHHSGQGENVTHVLGSDQAPLTDLTKQCHEKISALTKMIEEIRQQAVLHSPHSDLSHESTASPLPLDTTSYMSPPSKVLDWAGDMMPPQTLEGLGDTSMFDPYASAMRQLLEDVRLQMSEAAVDGEGLPQTTGNVNRQGQANALESWETSEIPRTTEPETKLIRAHPEMLRHIGGTGDQACTKQAQPTTVQGILQPISDLILPTLHPSKHGNETSCAQVRPRPPVAFWRNYERCNMSSPTEPHELSTIPELGATISETSGEPEALANSPQILSPTTPSTPPDVIAELLRRKLLTSPFSWAKKLNEARSPQHFSPNSNSLNSTSLKSSNKESDVSSGNSRNGNSDISASKESSSLSHPSQFSHSGGSRDWKTNILKLPADLYSSTDEGEGDFRRMGLGWVGAMLRKTKEAGALSSTSSSEGVPISVNTMAQIDDTDELKDISEIVEEDLLVSGTLLADARRGRSHSTPVKHVEFSSSSSSCLLSGDSRLSSTHNSKALHSSQLNKPSH